MNIFLSWSGERSRLVAEAFQQCLPLIFDRLDIYLSTSMNKGIRWNVALNQALDKADFAILCVTKENYSAPWLIYEAGVLSKTAGADKVAPFLLDADFPKFHGPITEFQQCTVFEREDLRKLIFTVSEIYAQREKGIPPSILEGRFKMAYDDAEMGLERRLKEALAVQTQEDGTEDMARKTLANSQRLLDISKENQTLLRDIIFDMKNRCP